MLSAVSIFYFPLIRGIGALEKFLHQIDGIVQVEIVHVADIDMDFPLELRPQRLPIPLHDVAKIVILAPVGGAVLPPHGLEHSGGELVGRGADGDVAVGRFIDAERRQPRHHAPGALRQRQGVVRHREVVQADVEVARARQAPDGRKNE